MVDHLGLNRQCHRHRHRRLNKIARPLLSFPFPWGNCCFSLDLSNPWPKSNGWLVGCSVKFQINRQSTDLSCLLYSCSWPFSVEHFTHPLFTTSLSFASLGTFLTAMFNVIRFHSWIMGLCFCVAKSKIKLELQWHSFMVTFLRYFCSRGKGAMRLSLCEAPTRDTRPDHNTGNYVLYSFR